MAWPIVVPRLTLIVPSTVSELSRVKNLRVGGGNAKFGQIPH
jgi:hypothetical protein